VYALYKEDHFVNIVKSHERNQPNTNSTIKITENVAKQLKHWQKKGRLTMQNQV
jgi:hypothetical protein